MKKALNSTGPVGRHGPGSYTVPRPGIDWQISEAQRIPYRTLRATASFSVHGPIPSLEPRLLPELYGYLKLS
jgi:hypothetical protein